MRAMMLFVALLNVWIQSATAQTHTILKVFSGTDGDQPSGDLLLSGNTLYGTTRTGGVNDSGTVFKVNTDGTGFAVIKSFSAMSGFPAYTNRDGAFPEAGLAISGGTLFGMARGGGTWGKGTVFKVGTNGTDYTVLKAFPALTDNGVAQTNSDGASPFAAVTLSGSTLYGTTAEGGSSGNGTVFKLDTNGAVYTVLKDFPPTSLYPYYTNADGAAPLAGLAIAGDTLYGTTYGGGISGHGTVFKINTNGADFTVLKSFSSISTYPYTNSDGAQPRARLTISDATVYGTTWQGGSSGLGTVFKMYTNGTEYTVLKNFTQNDGWSSYAGVEASGGGLYGVTALGGSFGQGTVFRMNADGTDYTVLKNFSAAYPFEGANPRGGLILRGRILYGTTEIGGGFNEGTVYKLALGLALTIQRMENGVVLSWPDATFSLEAAPVVSGPFTNIPGALSPYTNTIVGNQQYFRLRMD
jgi:uncharacterized repeat protein (TIGR03803 family)